MAPLTHQEIHTDKEKEEVTMTETDPRQKEIWRNVSKGTVVIQTFDRRGEVKDELVPGGNKVSLTRDERVFNMENAADDRLDNFRNGSLVPVKLLDDVEAAAIASNPNLLGEEDLRKLVKNKKGFQAKVEEISNFVTLSRLHQIALEEDASIRQMQMVEDRMKAVDPNTPVAERTQTPLPRSNKPVTP